MERVKHFRAICLADVVKVPTLKEYLNGTNIPKAIAPNSIQTNSPPKIASYISSYEVLDASQYQLVIRCVGQKVELVGQVVAVASGFGKYGRGTLEIGNMIV